MTFMTQVNIHEAKTHFSRLVERVNAGEEIVVAKAGQPMVLLVPFRRARKERIPGSARGQVKLREGFDDPLPKKIMRHFR